MARAVWNGVVSFGLVSIPVKLYSAVSKKAVKFNQIDSKSMSRIKQLRVNSDGDEVAYEDIVKGYEVEKDSYVILSADELAAVAPKASRTIDIQAFVSESDIDPLYYDSPYHLVPDELARKPYALLIQAMAESDKVVMRAKEYLVALRPQANTLTMSTMVYADEVVAPASLPGMEEIDLFEPPTDAEVAMATQLIESLTAEFDPTVYADTYRDSLLEIIAKKSSGELETVASAETENDAAVLDLMAALQASVDAAKHQGVGGDDQDVQSA